jgi:hypothetical protein
MIQKIVEYQVKESELDKCLVAIRDFVAAIKSNEPDTFYEAYQADDKVSFIHIMRFPDRNAEEAHKNAVYTLKFVDILYPSCEVTPVFRDISTLMSTV